MIMAILASVMMSAGEPVSVWVYARDMEQEVAVPRADTYAVWVWGAVGQEVEATVAGKAFHAKIEGEKKEEYAWARAGELAIDLRQVPVTAGPGVYAVVLTAGGAVSPKEAMPFLRVMDVPKGVSDRRARTARHTDTVFVMPHFDSVAAWEAYAQGLRRRVALSSGLVPLPEKTPLNARIFDRTQHDDYSVEKVCFESRPGFFVTGNLYRPVGNGPFPGVVCPHGHWEEGRLANEERGSVPGRCITMARMGMVVFSYDMVGYVDSLQFKHNWGGPREKLWAVHPFAMQLWNSIRAVDFITSLPEVDATRIACTGASGGGTQTFALCAVEPRITAAAPVNMISSTMQGGCLCENAPILRLNNSNMEIGALMAPKPLLMVSATGDWTKETPRVEFPAIRSIYGLYGAEDHVANVHVDAGHNYNQASREAVYRFFGKWVLGSDAYATYTEPAFTVEPDEKLRVFPDNTLPEGTLTGDQVIEEVIAANKAKWYAVLPATPDAVPAFREQYGDVLGAVLGVSIPAANDLGSERMGFVEKEGYAIERWVIRRTAVDDAMPALLFRGYGTAPQDAVVVVHGEGKAALADPEHGAPGPLVAGLIAQGKAVLCIDAFLLGEHHAPDAYTKRLKVGLFMDTFQPTDTGCRVQDILTAAAFLRARRDMSGNVDLVGLGEGGVWALLASAVDGRAPRTLVDLNGFDAANDEAWVERHYIPCIRSIGGLQTAVALVSPRALWVGNAGGAQPLLGAASLAGPPMPEQIIEWLK